MRFFNLITAGSSQIAQAVLEQSQVTADIDRNVLSIKTLADDSSQGSQHAVHGINQLVRQLSNLGRLVRQFQKAPRPPSVATKYRCRRSAGTPSQIAPTRWQSPQKKPMGQQAHRFF
ncbi:hypothetical protein FICEBENF_00780 [Aeromonas hydrophila]|nr:hypothetical protein VU14_03870 [Aeromonas hydrophila]